MHKSTKYTVKYTLMCLVYWGFFCLCQKISSYIAANQLSVDREHSKLIFREQAWRIDVLNEYYLVHSITAPQRET